jgi:hypothetical protein
MRKRVKVRAPRCPHCPYAFVAPARFRWYEWPMALVLRRPYRCQTCQNRYFGKIYPKQLLEDWFRKRPT